MEGKKSPVQLLQQYISARRPIIYINHFDFEAVDRMIESACSCIGKRGYEIVEFSPAAGRVDFRTKNKKGASPGDLADFLQKFNSSLYKDIAKETIVILKEVHDDIKDKRIYSALQTIACRKNMSPDIPGDYFRITIVIVDSKMAIPPELEKFVSVINFRPPTDVEIEKILRETAKANDGVVDEASLKDLTMALSGLSEFEIVQITKLALAKHGEITKDDLELIFDEKRQAIQKSGLLELVDTSKKVDIGDFDNLVGYLEKKAFIFKDLVDAREHGVDAPAGIILVGMPGCGKSLSARCVAEVFNCPLLKLDVGRLLGKYVGESDGNLRKAIQVAEAASPCILWIDEIEKAFAGAGGGEVMTRMFGYFLTWMQEKTLPIYVLATANDISNLPPEFKRRGRFDEIFKVELPKGKGIADIFKIHLKMRMGKQTGGTIPEDIDLNYLVQLCEDDYDGSGTGKMYSGADIASIVKSAAENAYLDGKRLISQEDLELLIEKTTSSCKSQEKTDTYKKMVAALKDADYKSVSSNT